MPLTKYVLTTEVPIIWAHVVTPKAENATLGIPSRYEVTFVFTEDHPDFAAIKAALAAAMKDLKAAGRKVPIERGDKLADAAQEKDRDRECLRGKLLVKAHLPLMSRKKEALLPPRLYVAQDGKFISHSNRADYTSAFYNGVMVRGEITIIPFEGMGGGASIWVNELVSYNHGDRLNVGGGEDPQNKYGTPVEYVGHVSSKDPTAGAEISY